MFKGVDHVLNSLVVANVIRISVIDDGADAGVDNLFQIWAAGPHPVSYRWETRQRIR